MFENLTEKLQRTFKNLRGQGKLTEENISEAMRELRLALLEADVNFKVVKDLIDHIREKAVGQEVARAEQLVRSRVDSLVADGRRQVDEKVAVLQTQFQDRITRQREQLEQVKSELEAKVKEKASGITGGIQLPGGIKLPK